MDRQMVSEMTHATQWKDIINSTIKYRTVDALNRSPTDCPMAAASRQFCMKNATRMSRNWKMVDVAMRVIVLPALPARDQKTAGVAMRATVLPAQGRLKETSRPAL